MNDSVRLDDSAGQGVALRLRPPAHRVSRRAIPYWTVRALPAWIVVAVAEVIWALADRHRAVLHVVVGVLTVLAAAGHLSLMPRWRYRLHRWESTPDAVYTQQGWLRVERRIAPVSRVQTVDTGRGPLEQVFGLTTVTVTTASAAGPVTITGLDRDTAARLVDDITRTTAATPGDAT